MISKYKDNYFHLLPNCYITEGARRAIIQNTSTSTVNTIPLELSAIIQRVQDKKMVEIYEEYGKSNYAVLDSYFDFLISNNYAFITTEALPLIKEFKPIPVQWDVPFAFTNVIIDFSPKTQSHLTDAISELAELGCHSIQIRFLNYEEKLTILSVLNLVYKARKFSSVSIVCDSTTCEFHSDSLLETLVMEFPIISEVILYDCEYEDFYENNKLRFKVLRLNSKIQVQSCGTINSFYFSVNLKHYTESLSHNTCLNRKMAIDAEGNIKNCPSMKESFGNINNTTISKAVSQPGFKKYWTIKKEEIAKCRDCEFRHVCTDCRAYLENPEDDYSAPLKCGYDPHACVWEEWSSHPMKQHAIDHYNIRN